MLGSKQERKTTRPETRPAGRSQGMLQVGEPRERVQALPAIQGGAS